MKGNMSPIGLTTNMLISHAEEFHGKTEIVSVDVKGARRRTSWGEVGSGAGSSPAPSSSWVSKGSRVGTIAPNTSEHLELLYAISGFGGGSHYQPKAVP